MDSIQANVSLLEGRDENEESDSSSYAEESSQHVDSRHEARAEINPEEPAGSVNNIFLLIFVRRS